MVPISAGRASAVLFLLSALAVASPAGGAVFGVDVYGFSYHFDRRDARGAPFNEVNYGAGLNVVLARGRGHTAFADLSLYSDSFRKANGYVSIAWTHVLAGPLQGGVLLAASSSLAVNGGEPFLALVPIVSWREDRAALHLLYLPSAEQLNEYASVAAYATVYPFGLARATTGPRQGAPIGLQLATGGLLTPTNLDDATIALRAMSRAGSWRIAADLQGLLLTIRQRASNTSGSEDEMHRVDLDIRAERLVHAITSWGATWLIGGGPLVGYTNLDPQDSVRRWRLGAVGTWGVEWRLHPALSLALEQGALLTWSSGRREDVRGSAVLTRGTKALAIEPRPVRIAVTAWIGGTPGSR